MEEAKEGREIATVRELAEILRVHPSTIYRLLRLRSLPGFRVGSAWRVQMDSVRRWIAERQADRRGGGPADVSPAKDTPLPLFPEAGHKPQA